MGSASGQRRPCIRVPARDALHRAGALVDEPSHGRINKLLEQPLEPRAVHRREQLGLADGGAEKPGDHSNVVDEIQDRGRPVGPHAARPAPRCRSRRHRCAATCQPGSRGRARPAAAADDQRSRQAGPDVGRGVGVERPAPAHPDLLIHGRLTLDIGLGDRGGAALGSVGVLRLDHLLDVVDLVLSLDFGRPGRFPIDEIGAAARIGAPDEDENADAEGDRDERKQDEVHAGSLEGSASGCRPISSARA